MSSHPSINQYPEVGLQALLDKITALFEEYGYRPDETGELPYLVTALVAGKLDATVPVQNLFYEVAKLDSPATRYQKIAALSLYIEHLVAHHDCVSDRYFQGKLNMAKHTLQFLVIEDLSKDLKSADPCNPFLLG